MNIVWDYYTRRSLMQIRSVRRSSVLCNFCPSVKQIISVQVHYAFQ